MTLLVAAAAGPLTATASGALAVPVLPAADGGQVRVGEGAEVLAELGVDPAVVLGRDKATGAAGEVSTVVLARAGGPDVVLLAGVGDGSAAALRKAASAVVRAAKASPALTTTLAHGRGPSGIRAVAEAFGLASYSFQQLRSMPKPVTLVDATLIVERPEQAEDVLARAEAVVEAVRLARDLSNLPSLEKTPAWMAEQAVAFCEPRGVSVRIRDEHDLARAGFGGILAVGAGSTRPPRLLELSWRPAGARQHVVLVGKGITFDSGGLSLKPSDGMVAMKTDMAGGAAVIATMTALQALDIRTAVTALVPLAENMPGASATRPSDVVHHYGGRTSEVLNTDAEGRIVLADALAYAVAELAPDAIVDIATLTGAATLGLGKRHGALYATTDRLRDGLRDAATAAGERLWPMPLVEDYRFALESTVADLRNIGDPKAHVSGGSITAALFLREFVTPASGRQIPWAHLDVAGPARADADEDEVTKGATGFGVRTFLEWLSH